MRATSTLAPSNGVIVMHSFSLECAQENKYVFYHRFLVSTVRDLFES